MFHVLPKTTHTHDSVPSSNTPDDKDGFNEININDVTLRMLCAFLVLSFVIMLEKLSKYVELAVRNEET